MLFIDKTDFAPAKNVQYSIINWKYMTCVSWITWGNSWITYMDIEVNSTIKPQMPMILRLRNRQENLSESKILRILLGNAKEESLCKWLATHNHPCSKNNTRRRVVNIRLSVWSYQQNYFDFRSVYDEYQTSVILNMSLLINVKYKTSTMIGSSFHDTYEWSQLLILV